MLMASTTLGGHESSAQDGLWNLLVVAMQIKVREVETGGKGAQRKGKRPKEQGSQT